MTVQGRLSQLVLHGGEKLRTEPWPNRGLFGQEEKAAAIVMFDEAIKSGNAFGYNGPEEKSYCEEFAEFMGGGYADAVNSGTTAVYVALKALDLKPFSEIIVGGVTDCGGMMPIPLLNCIPVVADCAPGCYNTGPEQIEELITPYTSAILLAHIAGEPADMEGIMAVARKHGLPVVEDCAQAHGANINGQPLGTFGDISAFSTMFGKHHCTGGQGGIVFTKNEDLYWSIKRCSDRGKPFGLEKGTRNFVASLNFNLDELSSAIGRVQLKKLPEIVARRREFAARLREAISDSKTISVPGVVDGAQPSYWFLRFIFNGDAVSCDKKTFTEALIAEGLPVLENYRHAMPHTFDWFVNKHAFGDSQIPWSSPEYKGDVYRKFPCPNANEVMETQFILLISEAWGEQEVADTAAIFNKVESAYSNE